MRSLLLLFSNIAIALAGTVHVEIRHVFGGKPLLLESLRYQVEEVFSVTRLSYLLSDFSLQKDNGEWVELTQQFSLIDLGLRRSSFSLTGVPAGNYRSIRFNIGVPKKENHADPSALSADHPLNPNLNNLHWNWAGGYIFLALEGKYYDEKKHLNGYVYHLANDENLSQVQLASVFQVKKQTALALSFDVQKLLNHPRPLSFQKDGNSTHSHPGDSIASALLANIQNSFSLQRISYPPDEIPARSVKPLYLPDKYEPFRFRISRYFSKPSLPRDNPLLEERVALGEMLFHDHDLSRDGRISCATCHDPKRAFTDGLALSQGIDGRLGDRNSMPLFNLAWKSSFFWDGRAKSLRDQVLQPIQDHREMGADLEKVVKDLEERMRPQFAKAFGPGPVTEEKIALALENFLLTLTSDDSKFDRAISAQGGLTALEKRGMELFFTEYEPRSGRFGADCFHCHGGANFSDHQKHDNGLMPGKDGVRKFVTPSLRNLTLTAPYMHDGRFQTLEEVIAHYSGPMNRTASLDPNLAKHPKGGLKLKEEDQKALVAFLKTLTDPKYEQ